jgi:CMP-N,N'-diacetyllegionaminic acid synthase
VRPDLNNLALMPARGGSKSIPRKNIALLAGRPLLSHGLKQIQASRYVHRIIVDTDDPEIAAVARRFGATTPYLRPAMLAQDDTSTIAVVENSIHWLAKNEDYRPDYILLVQPTEPFVRTSQIDHLFELVRAKDAESGITMVEISRNCHPYHVRHMREDGFLEFDQPELHYRHPNRQSDPKRYAFGNLYWFKTEAFLREKKIEAGKRVGLQIDALTAHDINNPLDLEIAERLLPLLEKEQS